MDEDLLVAKSIEGERDALEALFERHHAALASWLSRQLPTKWQGQLGVDDIAQETYIDALLDIRRFTPRGEGSFRRWLFAIARNNLRNAIKSLEAEKRGGTRRRVNSGEDAAVELFELVVGSSTPGRKIARSEAVSMLQAALKQLPSEYRSILQLYDMDAIPMREAAPVIGKSEGAAFMTRQRAIRAIQRILLDPLADYSTFS